MRLIALTGGIASGKSTFASLLDDYGYHIINLDKLYSELITPYLNTETLTPLAKEIVELAGTDIIVGKAFIDTKKLAKFVFASTENKKAIEDLTHPVIMDSLYQAIGKAFMNKEDIVFCEFPLLFESNMQTKFDEIILVYTSYDIQLKRLIERTNMSVDEAKVRIAAQIPYTEKIDKVKWSICNDGGIIELSQAVKRLHEELKGESYV